MEQQKKQPEKNTGNSSLVFVLVSALIITALWCGGKKEREKLPPAQQCLSAWDGSHPQMTREVKSMLNNPASFEHLETRYIDRGSEIDLIMKFTGTNKLGGVVTNTATATIDKNCELIKGPVIL